jgi:hypothetical protein
MVKIALFLFIISLRFGQPNNSLIEAGSASCLGRSLPDPVNGTGSFLKSCGKILL